MAVEATLAQGSGVAWDKFAIERSSWPANANAPDVELRQVSSSDFRPGISIQGWSRKSYESGGQPIWPDGRGKLDFGNGLSWRQLPPIKPATEIVRPSTVWSASNRNPALKRLLELSTILANRKAVVRADRDTLEAAT